MEWMVRINIGGLLLIEVSIIAELEQFQYSLSIRSTSCV